jgi:hypothetical protein
VVKLSDDQEPAEPDRRAAKLVDHYPEQPSASCAVSARYGGEITVLRNL